MRWQCLDWNGDALEFYRQRVGAKVIAARMFRLTREAMMES